MQEHEFAEVLRFARDRMRAYGFGVLDERILSDISIDPGGPFTQLTRYIETLESEVRLGSDDAIRTTINRFRQFLGTESGVPVAGIQVVMSNSDAVAFGVDRIDLGVGADLESVIDDLSALALELRESRDGGS